MKIFNYKNGDSIGDFGCKFIEFAAPRIISGRSREYAIIQCKCGKPFTTDASRVRRNLTKSCGCFQKKRATEALMKRLKENGHLGKIKHNKTKSTEYVIWVCMIQRCHNPFNPGFHKYGGRGILVCEEWYNSFETFYKDMGDRPSKEYTVDRIDNSKGYERGNCRWATRRQQDCNKRTTVFVTYNGITKPLIEWVDELHLPYDKVAKRIRRFNWSPEKAFTYNI